MKRRVVITGMGVISPIGNDIDTFWKNAVEGNIGIGPITRFDASQLKASVAAEVKDFDPAAYGLDKRDIRRMDLFTQYAMAAAQQAVEQSGIVGNIEPERLGVYIGSGTGGMLTFINETKKMLEKGPGRISPNFIPTMILNMATGNVAIKYNAQGPSLPTVTACATSTNSVGEAFHAILNGYADGIIAGGTEATITELAVGGFVNCQALNLAEDPALASLPFDKRRAGFVIGEGSGILVLEEYEHAKARGANIIAEICGYGNTNDAHHVTAPRPDGSTAAKAIALAAQEAGLSAEDELYINAHGTGTPLNDPSETKAIKLAIGEDLAYKAHVSSTKSVTGHMLGAAGAIEAIVCALALKNGVVPPTAGLEQQDEECDLDCTPINSKKADLTIALSSSLGFGGHNACVALRAYKG